MLLKIERGVKNGCNYIKFNLDGVTSPCIISRKLTNTTSEDHQGILTETGAYKEVEVEMRIRQYSKIFLFGELDLFRFTKSQIVTELKNRIKLVKDWVDTIDFRDVINIDL